MNEWISYPEHKPKYSKKYLVTTIGIENGHPNYVRETDVSYYHLSPIDVSSSHSALQGRWVGLSKIKLVVAFMDMPEPYRESVVI